MNFISTFAPYIIGLIEQKQALGYKYQSEQSILRRFDLYCLEHHPLATKLTNEIITEWAIKRPNESLSTVQCRLSPVRELAKYMLRMGFEAYIMPKGLMPRVPKYMPYIYSNNELKRIFEQTDRCNYCYEVPYRHWIMPIFFRLLYCSGMRATEARLLKVDDVNLVNGVITADNLLL